MGETKYWLWLSMVFGTGSRRIWEAMSLFESAADAYREINSAPKWLGLRSDERRNIESATIEEAEILLEKYESAGIKAVGYGDELYPPQLRLIMNPPALLYYKGDIGCLSASGTVTAVGARKASEYSLFAAERICRELSEAGNVIVSGFAVGIDITSQMAAVSLNRPSAAVLGCGVDVDYPRDNVKYRERIINAGGAIISEFPPGTPPHSGNFPRRNRILSALGCVTIVFEASSKSGSIITAGLAAEQGREVFILPPANIFSKNWSGNALLLSEGALPLFSVQDIFDSLAECPLVPKNTEKISTAVSRPASGGERPVPRGLEGISGLISRGMPAAPKREAPAEKKPPEKKAPEKRTAPAKKNLPEGLEGVQLKIAELLAEGTLHADVIAQKLNIDAGELMTELTELEILGIVRALPGKMFSL